MSIRWSEAIEGESVFEFEPDDMVFQGFNGSQFGQTGTTKYIVHGSSISGRTNITWSNLNSATGPVKIVLQQGFKTRMANFKGVIRLEADEAGLELPTGGTKLIGIYLDGTIFLNAETIAAGVKGTLLNMTVDQFDNEGGRLSISFAGETYKS
jgi:hypothetical protein